MFNFGENQIVGLAMKCLMVAGGYAAGYVLTMFAGIGFDKLVTHRKSPDELHKVARIFGGLIAAILVALLVFGGFGGGGSGDGKGEGQGDRQGQSAGTGTNSATDPAATKPTDPAKTEASVTVEAVRVRVLAGDEVEKGSEKFYRLDGRPTGVDRGGLAAVVGDRKKGAKGAVVVVYEFGREAGPKTIGFAELEAVGKELGVQVMSEEEYRRFVKR
jgi:hypothetical protein